jgi:hypothetical protein
MKKIIDLIKNLFNKKNLTLDPNSIENVILNTLNTIIQSPQIQGLTFKTSSGCDKTSVINDIEFCNEVYVHDKYTWSVIDDVCVSACKGVKDTCRGACDVGCLGISSCTKPCKKGCDSAYDGCVDLCSYTDLSGGYEFRLTNIKGVGGIQVTNVYNVVPKENEETKSPSVRLRNVLWHLWVQENKPNPYKAKSEAVAFNMWYNDQIEKLIELYKQKLV